TLTPTQAQALTAAAEGGSKSFAGATADAQPGSPMRRPVAWIAGAVAAALLAGGLFVARGAGGPAAPASAASTVSMMALRGVASSADRPAADGPAASASAPAEV